MALFVLPPPPLFSFKKAYGKILKDVYSNSVPRGRLCQKVLKIRSSLLENKMGKRPKGVPSSFAYFIGGLKSFSC